LLRRRQAAGGSSAVEVDAASLSDVTDCVISMLQRQRASRCVRWPAGGIHPAAGPTISPIIHPRTRWFRRAAAVRPPTARSARPAALHVRSWLGLSGLRVIQGPLALPAQAGPGYPGWAGSDDPADSVVSEQRRACSAGVSSLVHLSVPLSSSSSSSRSGCVS